MNVSQTCQSYFATQMYFRIQRHNLTWGRRWNCFVISVTTMIQEFELPHLLLWYVYFFLSWTIFSFCLLFAAQFIWKWHRTGHKPLWGVLWSSQWWVWSCQNYRHEVDSVAEFKVHRLVRIPIFDLDLFYFNVHCLVWSTQMESKFALPTMPLLRYVLWWVIHQSLSALRLLIFSENSPISAQAFFIKLWTKS